MKSGSVSKGNVLSLPIKEVSLTSPKKTLQSKTKSKSNPISSKPKKNKGLKIKNTEKTSPIKTKRSLLSKTKNKDKTTLNQRDRQTLLNSIKREPLGHLLVEHLLREAGFRGVVSSDKNLLDKYATDESIFYIKPQIVLQPKDQKDLETAVRVIARETKKFSSLSLTPRAAGTGLSGGSLTDSIVIDVCRHLNVIEEPKTTKNGVTIKCQPGAMWSEVEARLKLSGVYLPSFPASKDICTIGGAVANNSAGPDSLRYGHMADWVESLEVVLNDGRTYTIKPLTYKEFKQSTKQNNALSKILTEVLELIEKNEIEIQKSRPKTKKNTAGYALWDVINTDVESFKKGKGQLDLTRLITGSQGTIGIISSITLKTEPIPKHTSLIVVPVFDLATAGEVILEALKYHPINIEIFDGLTMKLALKNPNFFRGRLSGLDYYKTLLSLYTLYHVRYKSKIPEFTLLVTLDHQTKVEHPVQEIVREIRKLGASQARLVNNPNEKEMLWQIRRASYSLSKLQDQTKRPAPFLEDMTVPPENLPKFFMEIKRLLKKFNITVAIHGHGGNGHLHFYPLLDFSSPSTPGLIEKMSEEFFNLAIKHKGNICGEHNDGIIRTPHLNKLFNKKTISLFEKLENIFDPDDIFNPGKKVNPRFDIKGSIRHTN